jgi:hypothetical protein
VASTGLRCGTRRARTSQVPERSAVNGTLSQVMRNEAQVVVDVDKRSKVTAAAGMSASRCRPVSRHSFVTVSNLQDFSDTDSSCGVAVGPVLEDTYRSRTDADEVADAVESHRRRAFAARGSCCNSLRVNDDGRRLSPARLIGDDVHLARHTEQQRVDGHRVGGKMEPESTMGSGWRAGDRSARLQEDRGLPENRHWQRRPEFNGGDRPASDINSGDEDRRSHDNGRRRDCKRGNRSERKNMDSARGNRHQRSAGAGGDPSSSGSDTDDGGSRRHRGHWKEDGHSRRYPREKRRSTEPYPSFDSDDSDADGHSRRTTDCRRWLKPEKFDGRGSFETFLYMFENCAKYNGWKDDDKVAHLRWSLTGIAAQLLWDTSDLKYKELVEKLKGRFGGKGMEEKFQNELRYRRRGKGEGLRELAQDVRRLMALAYPGERSSLAEHIARDSFLSALDDPELELRIREHDPVDLDAAVKMALRFEVFRGVMEASSSGRHRVTRHVVHDSPESDSSEKIETRVLDLERQLKELKRQPQTRSDDDSKSTSKGLQRGDADRVQIRGKRNRNVQKSSKGQDGDRAEGVQVDSSGPMQKKDEQIAQLMAERDVLNREVGRLKCLEQQRNDAALATATASQLINPNAVIAPGAPVRQTGGCWKCGMVGHFPGIAL